MKFALRGHRGVFEAKKKFEFFFKWIVKEPRKCKTDGKKMLGDVRKKFLEAENCLIHFIKENKGQEKILRSL